MVFAGYLSNSGRSTWNECKFKYRCRYVDKIKERPVMGTGGRDYGNYIHKVFELSWLVTEFQGLQDIANAERPNHTFPREFDALTSTCLQNYWKFVKGFPTENQPLPEWRFKLQFKNDINHVGVVDRIILGENNGVLIVDWKSGKRELNKVKLRADLQLQGYATAIHCKYQIPIENITCAHFYPRTGNFVPIKFNKAILKNWVRGYLKDVWNIRKAKKVNLVPEINQFCDWCDYRYACPKADCPSGMSTQIISENKVIRTDEDKESSKERDKLTENILFTPELF